MLCVSTPLDKSLSLSWIAMSGSEKILRVLGKTGTDGFSGGHLSELPHFGKGFTYFRRQDENRAPQVLGQ